jgi:hypothetical protein
VGAGGSPHQSRGSAARVAGHACDARVDARVHADALLLRRDADRLGLRCLDHGKPRCRGPALPRRRQRPCHLLVVVGRWPPIRRCLIRWRTWPRPVARGAHSGRPFVVQRALATGPVRMRPANRGRRRGLRSHLYPHLPPRADPQRNRHHDWRATVRRLHRKATAGPDARRHRHHHFLHRRCHRACHGQRRACHGQRRACHRKRLSTRRGWRLCLSPALPGRLADLARLAQRLVLKGACRAGPH